MKADITKQDIDNLVLLFEKCETRSGIALFRIRRREIKWLTSMNEIYNMSSSDITYFHRQLMISIGLLVL